MKRLLLHLLCLILLNSVIRCASTTYSPGVQNLKAGRYEAAIAAFKPALILDPDNPDLLRDIGIAYFHASKLDTAKYYLNRSLDLNSADGNTLFYLGGIYETENDLEKAINCYRQYTELSHLESMRNQIEARLLALMQKQIRLDIRNLLAQESNLDVATIPDTTLAVLYFRNMGDNKKLNPIQKGLTDMLITDFSKVEDISVVERIRIQKMLEEMGLGQTGLIDSKTAPRIGRMLGVRTLINGAFVNFEGAVIQINAAIVDTKNEKPMQTGRVKGKLLDLFKLEKNLVFGVVKSLGIELSQEERDAIEIIPTESLLAFMAYCHGLDLEDQGLFREAGDRYQEALRIDPSYGQARQNLTRANSLGSLSLSFGNLAKQYAEVVSEGQSETASSPGSQADNGEASGDTEIVTSIQSVSLTDQIVRTGSMLDQSFLPGVDSRDPAQEENKSSFGNTADIHIQVPLPEPPNTR